MTKKCSFLCVVMSSQDDDNSGQPVWHSVLIFCCKGMIEGIIVVLFMWLLIQVLFTKHLEVHLQILLGVGLVVFCLSLVLGCVLCWRRTQRKPPEDKKIQTSAPPPPVADHVTLPVHPSVSSEATSTKVDYEELEGDVLDYPSAFESSTPSDDNFSTMSFASRPCANSELNNQPKSCFPLRRLSSPTLSTPFYRPIVSGRSSLPSFPKLGLLSKTQKVLKHHCTVSGDICQNSENILLTTTSPSSISSIQHPSQPVENPLFPSYGLNVSYENTDPSLNFTMTYSAAQQTLTISLLGFTGTVYKLGGVMVQASLPPLCPGPLDVSDQPHSFSSDLHRKSLVLQVHTLEELQSCTLRLAVFSRERAGAKASLLGRLDVHCGRIDWILDRPITCTSLLR